MEHGSTIMRCTSELFFDIATAPGTCSECIHFRDDYEYMLRGEITMGINPRRERGQSGVSCNKHKNTVYINIIDIYEPACYRALIQSSTGSNYYCKYFEHRNPDTIPFYKIWSTGITI